MSFAETIRRYRKERGWTLEALSKRADLSVAQLSKLETGKSEPSIDSLRKLAAVYGVAVSALTQPEGREPLAPVRRGGGFVVQAGEDGRVTLRYLTMRRSAKMQPVEAALPGGATLELGQPAPGEAFFLRRQRQGQFLLRRRKLRDGRGRFALLRRFRSASLGERRRRGGCARPLRRYAVGLNL